MLQEAGLFFWGLWLDWVVGLEGGFRGSPPDTGGFGGIPPLQKKGGVLGGLPPKRVLLKSTNLDYYKLFFYILGQCHKCSTMEWLSTLMEGLSSTMEWLSTLMEGLCTKWRGFCDGSAGEQWWRIWYWRSRCLQSKD